jgi:hypothetical protein
MRLVSSHTVHTNTQTVYVGFCYLLVNVSVITTDHHQIEKYRYRRKSAKDYGCPFKINLLKIEKILFPKLKSTNVQQKYEKINKCFHQICTKIQNVTNEVTLVSVNRTSTVRI